MARISSPLTGPIVNINAQTVSRQVISGGGGRGVDVGGGGGGGTGTERGSAIIVRPQTSLVDRTQNLQIQQTQQSISAIQPSLEVIVANVQVLNNGIERLGRQLLLEGQVEQKNLKDQQESERKLNERQIRQGRENLLEKRITAALARPIVNIQKKVVGLFDRIMGAMTTLFFGWLTNQGIETLKAYAAGDTKKLEEIKNSVIKNILFTIGAFAAIKLGFGLVMRTLTAVTFRIAGLAAKIALAPFRAVGAFFSKMFGFGGKLPSVRSPGRVPITTSGGNILSRSGGIFSGTMSRIRNATRFLAKPLGAIGRAAPIIGTTLNVIGAGGELMKGNLTGAGLYGAAAITSLIPGGQGASLALSLGAMGQSMFYKPASKTPAPDASTTSPPPASVQPQTTATPQFSDFQFSADTANQFNAFSEAEPQASDEPTSIYGNINMEGLQQQLTEANKKVTPAKVQAPPKAAAPVGTLPEIKPNVIIAAGGQDRTQVAAAPSQQPLTDVPFIPSGNTDNFYVLYSQLNYNVVM